MRKIKGNHRKRVVRALRRRDGNNNCQHCGKQFGPLLEPTIDHIHPKSMGGTNALSNLQLLCYPCNKKRDMWIRFVLPDARAA